MNIFYFGLCKKIMLDVIFQNWKNNVLVLKNEPDRETLVLLTGVFIYYRFSELKL